MAPKQYEQWKWPGYAAQDRSGYYSGRSGRSGQDLPYNPEDPVLGTDMTQGEWDQLRSLLRKAEDGGKMNELMSVHRKEVKNAPMNRHYPPADDEWQECQENTQQPVTSPKVLGPASNTANSSTSVHGASKSSSTATAAEFKGPWKVPPIAPPDSLKKAIDAGVVHGSWRDWKGRPYDPSDDPWVTDDQPVGETGNKKPILQIFGNVVQSNADVAAAKAAAAAVDAMARQAADNVGAAGFPDPSANVPTPPPPPAKATSPVSAAALGSEQLLQELIKGKGKDDKGKGKDEYKGKGKDEYKGKGKDDKGKGKDDKGKGKDGKDGKGDYGKGPQPKNPNLQLPVPKTGERPGKCVRISEETEVQEEGNSQNSSNKMHEGGAMNDSSKRRHEAMVQTASDSEDEGSFSVITAGTGDSPPIFPNLPYGLPSTFKWKDDWEHPTAEIDYEEVDFAIPRPAWIRDTYEWSCTKLKMGKYENNQMSFHTFVEKVFNKSPEECKYAKKMIGQFRKRVTSTPRTQGPDFCAFLLHCRVDAFLNAGYVYERDFEWR